MPACRLCKQGDCELLIDFGSQPVCHRFVSVSGDKEPLFPLKMGICRRCGLLQLTDSVPAEKLLPRLDWVKYNEPEGHLDSMVNEICRLPQIHPDSLIIGLSEKDDSTLERLAKRGYANIRRLSLIEDLGAVETGAGIESVQSRFTDDKIPALHKKYGRPHLVIARHVLEHTHKTLEFITTLKNFVKPGGYIVLEVPDFRKALKTFNYAAVWEEHSVYFTPETFRAAITMAKMAPYRTLVYPYAHEDSLGCIVHGHRDTKTNLPVAEAIADEVKLAKQFAGLFTEKREKIRNCLNAFHQEKGSVAIYGTGHAAVAFINLLELQDIIAFAVDDCPVKQQYLLPGSQIPIKGADDLNSQGIKKCLLSLSPESEKKVLGRMDYYLSHGGSFSSIFPRGFQALTPD